MFGSSIWWGLIGFLVLVDRCFTLEILNSCRRKLFFLWSLLLFFDLLFGCFTIKQWQHRSAASINFPAVPNNGCIRSVWRNRLCDHRHWDLYFCFFLLKICNSVSFLSSFLPTLLLICGQRLLKQWFILPLLNFALAVVGKESFQIEARYQFG